MHANSNAMPVNRAGDPMDRGRVIVRSERGTALVMVVIFSFLALGFAALFLNRTQVEVKDARIKFAKVTSLFGAHSALSRAHVEINENMDSVASLAENVNVALADPEACGDVDFIKHTNHAVRVRTVKPSNNFDANGDELPPTDAAGNEVAYEELPFGWYSLESRVYEPMYVAPDGTPMGLLKVVRQYVRDGTPLSNNFIAVIDDDLGLGGSPVNPGKPAEGEIHTNKHLYIMTANPYYANRLLAVDGVSYTAGATEAGTVYLHPDNNFEADPLYLPLPSSLTANPDDPDSTLKQFALGASPQSISLSTSNPDYQVKWNGISSLNDLKKSGTNPTPTMKINVDADGTCRGVCAEGYVHSEVTLNGDTMTIRLTKYNDPNKYVQVSGVPAPNDGVLFFDTRVDISGGVTARTTLQGDVTTRLTMATTGNVDVVGSVRYKDGDGDYATKLSNASALVGVADEDLGTVPVVSDSTKLASNANVQYFANTRPPGVAAENGDGFYDGDAVLGVVASQDIILKSTMPENAEMAGAYLSLQQRLTLEGLTYNSAGALTSVSSTNPFYYSKGGRSSVRRFGGLISDKRPCTTVVTNTGAFYYGFSRGFSLFDEKMKQKPPPFFPKDKKPQYLGWELKDLGVKPIQ